MDIKIIEKDFNNKLNINYSSRSKYYDFQFHSFQELNEIVFEINNCLLLEFYNAAITLTNNLLERLLKLALIYNEVGVKPIPIDQWGTIFIEPNKKYGSQNLGSTINLCKKFNLISQDEKEFLFDIIRDLMRNGFSHADSSKILNNIPETTIMYEFSLEKDTGLKPVNVDQRNIPIMQTIHMKEFAIKNAGDYFDYIFELIKKIDQRLINK